MRTGARPSPGAATFEAEQDEATPGALDDAEVAAPEDGRTPERSVQGSAVTMQLDAAFPLTLTLSLRERGQPLAERHDSPAGEHSSAQSNLLPLHKGEGRGEGEGSSQLNRYGSDRGGIEATVEDTTPSGLVDSPELNPG